MAISSASKTSSFPRYREKTFALAPQPAEDTAATTGFTYLHYTDYDPDRQQSFDSAEEFGDIDDSVDPVQVDAGDVTVTSPLQVRMCLNEVGYHLAHMFGAPVSSGPVDGKYTHVFTSGKSELPYATLQDSDSQSSRTARDVAYNGLKLSIARGGGVQLCDFDFKAKDLTVGAAAALAGGDVSAGPARLFVDKNAWRVLVDDVQLGRVLSFNWTYSADIQEDRYVEASDVASAFYVGNPSLKVDYEVRMITEAQRAAIGGLENPQGLTLIGDGGGGTSITVHAPDVKAPQAFPRKDDKLQKLMFDGTATRIPGVSPEAMATITLVNTVAAY